MEWGFGDLSSNLVANGLAKSLIKPTNILLFLEGLLGEIPSDVTIHTGSSNPGFNLFYELLVEEINGFITS